jgi:hypothetical protein
VTFPAASASFPGINTTLGAEFTLSRGVYPSVCTLWLLPQSVLDLAPGTLTFNFAGGSIAFPGAAADLGFLRKTWDAKRPRWSLQILDRRWTWKSKAISGRYNIRLATGAVEEASRKNAQQLASLILEALGESGFDVSRVPTSVYPPFTWNNASARQALQDLCDYVACDVVLGLDNRVTIWPLGVGADAPQNQNQRHSVMRHKPRRIPGRIRLLGGPNVYQNKFSLEAVGREADGTQEKLADLTYAPDEWTAESPWSFPTATEDDDRAAAFESVYRQFRILELAGGGLKPSDSTYAVTKLAQLLPLKPTILEVAADLDDIEYDLPPYLSGTYWNYADSPENLDDARYTGPWKLDHAQGVAETTKPIFKLDTSYQFASPDLYLTCAYSVRDDEGNLEILEVEGAATGTGDLILQRPELFQTFRAKYTGTAVESVVKNTDDVLPEAQAYVQMFQSKFASPWAYEMEYAGLLPIALDGKIAQVKWSCHTSRQPLTLVGVNEEFDVHNLSDKQRRAYAAAG